MKVAVRVAGLVSLWYWKQFAVYFSLYRASYPVGETALQLTHVQTVYDMMSRRLQLHPYKPWILDNAILIVATWLFVMCKSVVVASKTCYRLILDGCCLACPSKRQRQPRHWARKWLFQQQGSLPGEFSHTLATSRREGACQREEKSVGDSECCHAVLLQLRTPSASWRNLRWTQCKSNVSIKGWRAIISVGTTYYLAVRVILRL